MPGADAHARHDLVVIGASAGGVEALREVVSGLPEDFPSTVVAVLHLASGGTSVLPSILDRAGPLRALPVEDSAELAPGTIFVGVPDCHVRIDDGHLQVAGGPRENGHRPAIDPLFRTAALSRGGRVVGVILSGALDDGTLGLRTIKAEGGVTIVQDPESALHPGMPQAAIRGVAPDRVLPADEIAAALVEFTRQAPPTGQNGRQMSEENAREQVREQAEDQRGDETGLTCPDCGGAIYEQRNGDVVTYRCRVGHQYGSDTFVAEQGKTVENSLWAALRLLEERALLMRRLAERHEGAHGSTGRFGPKAEELEQHGAELTKLLREITASPQPLPGDETG